MLPLSVVPAYLNNPFLNAPGSCILTSTSLPANPWSGSRTLTRVNVPIESDTAAFSGG
jgi:hypothetical protein